MSSLGIEPTNLVYNNMLEKLWIMFLQILMDKIKCGTTLFTTEYIVLLNE